MNRTTFFAYVRNAPFGGRLTQRQVDGLNAILDAGETLDPRWLAYALATAFWETGKTMWPVRETLAKSDAEAIRNLDAAFGDGKLPQVRAPYWRDGFFGRGFVQLTHRENYKKAGDMIGVDLVGNPSAALELKNAARILIEGMQRGIFTGKAFKHYFSTVADDPKGARRIINGQDKATLIGQFHHNFLDAITKAQEVGEELPPDVSEEDAKPDDVLPRNSGTMVTAIGGLVGSGAASLFTAIENPFALAAFALVVVTGAALAYLIFTGRLKINRRAQ